MLGLVLGLVVRGLVGLLGPRWPGRGAGGSSSRSMCCTRDGRRSAAAPVGSASERSAPVVRGPASSGTWVARTPAAACTREEAAEVRWARTSGLSWRTAVTARQTGHQAHSGAPVARLSWRPRCTCSPTRAACSATCSASPERPAPRPDPSPAPRPAPRPGPWSRAQSARAPMSFAASSATSPTSSPDPLGASGSPAAPGGCSSGPVTTCAPVAGARPRPRREPRRSAPAAPRRPRPRRRGRGARGRWAG